MDYDYVVGLDQIGKDDIKKVGGKGANLGEMIKIGIPVPEGFVVTTSSFDTLIQAHNLGKGLQEIIKNTNVDTNVDDTTALLQASKKLKELILSQKMPDEVMSKVKQSYKNLSSTNDAVELNSQETDGDSLVAVRSSATAEDLPTASFAGQQATFLNVTGEKNLIESITNCWASLFEPRAIFYRTKHGISKASIAVIVQKMIDSKKSGTLFTIDPTTGENVVLIEAIWGLGEGIVGGEVSPDLYTVGKNGGEKPKIIDIQVSSKTKMRVRDYTCNRTVQVDVAHDKITAQVLTEQEILELANYGLVLENHYDQPQDIEFAISSNNKITILQTRPITSKVMKRTEFRELKGKQLLKGTGASPGVATGKVRIIMGKGEITKIEDGDIIVTTMTSPDLVPAMSKSAAIITDQGGKTCHAAIVSREMGIPAIVGTRDATNKLKDRQQITVDAYNGIVYEGKLDFDPSSESNNRYIGSFTAAGTAAVPSTTVKTKTKVKVNLAFPQRLQEMANKADGVGLLRLEHMVAQSGIHPARLIKAGEKDKYVKILMNGIRPIAKAFDPKPIWVRTLDARSDEFRNLKGGEDEPKEANPMLGWHGIRRSLDEPELLKAEFEAVAKLYQEGYKNLEIMLPFVISTEEVKRAKGIANEMGLENKMKIGIMVETPSSVMIIEELCKEVTIAFASFGTNDLVQLVLGVDRNNERLANIYSASHPAILRSMKTVINTCNQFGVESSICGESGSNPEMAKILVKYGIRSISCNIDAIDAIRRAVYEQEQELAGSAR